MLHTVPMLDSTSPAPLSLTTSAVTRVSPRELAQVDAGAAGERRVRRLFPVDGHDEVDRSSGFDCVCTGMQGKGRWLNATVVIPNLLPARSAKDLGDGAGESQLAHSAAAAERKRSNANSVVLDHDHSSSFECVLDAGKVCEQECSLKLWSALRRPAKEHDRWTSGIASCKEGAEIGVGRDQHARIRDRSLHDLLIRCAGELQITNVHDVVAASYKSGSNDR